MVLRRVSGAAISIGDRGRFPDSSCTLRSPKLHVEDAKGVDDVEAAACTSTGMASSPPCARNIFLPLVTFSSRL